MLFGKSSRFFPINHLWHIFFFPVLKVALFHDRKACTVSFSCRSENVWKIYSFEFLICFMQEMFCNCSLTSCLINASQAHHHSLSSCFGVFFPQNSFLLGKWGMIWLVSKVTLSGHVWEHGVLAGTLTNSARAFRCWLVFPVWTGYGKTWQ